MAAETKIEWCKRTWSPWTGCQKTGSPACEGCYAEAWAARSGHVGWGPHAQRRRTAPGYWNQLAKWDAAAAAAGERESVFPSLCDPFDNKAPHAWRWDFFEKMRATPNIDYLLLTKRAGNVVKMAEACGGWPPNAWLGGTIVTQDEMDRDGPKLVEAKRRLGIPVLFLSMEPLREAVDVAPWLPKFDHCPEETEEVPLHLQIDGQEACQGCDASGYGECRAIRKLGFDWIIAGGETSQGSHRARPSHPDWFREIRDACAAAGVPFFFKQWGDWRPLLELRLEEPTAGVVMLARDGVEAPWPFTRQRRDGKASRDWSAIPMRKVGRAEAGRHLDGQLHDARPAR